ncbi:MAG: GyrI-like domain-containing protein [Spirochaetales bacterium]|nr:GyrI-like domain-containing protein [Spirochaetales bacterium]
MSEVAKKNNATQLDKNSLIFNLMIRQPDFVTDEFALDIIERTKKKKPHELLNKAVFSEIEEGECVQMMHPGSYDNEPESFKQMEQYCKENKLTRESKQHREIYLSDVRKVSPEKLKTVLRFKVKN